MNTCSCSPISSRQFETSRFRRFLRLFWNQVEAPRTVCIRCSRGVLWITREGDERDYILAAGECLTLNDARQLVVLPLRAREIIEYSIREI